MTQILHSRFHSECFDLIFLPYAYSYMHGIMTQVILVSSRVWVSGVTRYEHGVSSRRKYSSSRLPMSGVWFLSV
jgi:hypothetical protein